MIWLLLVSIVWAFSFGLIKGRLTGIDPSLVACIRVLLALLVFLPFFRPRGLRGRDALTLVAIGAVQFGLMYVAYIASFRQLAAYEVVVMTIFTPLFVSLLAEGPGRAWRAWSLPAAAVATVGAGIVVMGRPLESVPWTGVGLIQLSNIAFAAGQVAYRKWKHKHAGVSDARVFALLYAGAVLATLPWALPAIGTIPSINTGQWLTLLYLGVIASGLCFFLWNFGAARTAAGPLAVVNNLKIPLAVACSLFVFGEQADLPRLIAGGGLVVAAGVLAEIGARRVGRS